MDLVWAEHIAAGRADRAVYPAQWRGIGPPLLGHLEPRYAAGATHAPELAAWPDQHLARDHAGRLPGAGAPPIPGGPAAGRRELDQADAGCDRDALCAAA